MNPGFPKHIDTSVWVDRPFYVFVLENGEIKGFWGISMEDARKVVSEKNHNLSCVQTMTSNGHIEYL